MATQVAGGELPPGLRLATHRAAFDLPPLPDGSGPELIGQVYEAALDAGARRTSGVHYTPPSVARRLVSIALADRPGVATVCDPTVGGGAFLLAAAEQLADRVGDRRAVAECLLWGADVDPGAVAVAEATITLWAGGDVDLAALRDHIVAADVLVGGVDGWPGGFDAVVGNPPFLGQLARATARDHVAAARARARFGDAAHGYTDTAGLFLLAALDLAADGGTVCLIQPASLLATRDSATLRRAVEARAAVTGLWLAGERVFAAQVRVCAPVLVRGRAARREVRRWAGAAVAEREPIAVVTGDTWAPMAYGLTSAAPSTAGRVAGDGARLGDLCDATAGFRDEYYGLVPHVADGGDGAPLVTAGLVDPGVCHWGRRPSRFAGRAFARPTVDVGGLPPDGRAARWVAANGAPKIVVATQTRVIEAAVDRHGRWVASVPTIAVDAGEAELWRILAVLLAPPVSAWAMEHFAGTALSSDAVKLSARQVLEIPLPTDRTAWDTAADVLEHAVTPAGEAGDEAAWRSALVEFGGVMTRAYVDGDPDQYVSWWAARLPSWQRSRRRTA